MTTWLFTQSLAAVPMEVTLADFAVKPLPLVLSTLALALLYALVPNRRVPWRHAFAGAFAAALAFEGAKHGFAVYVKNVPTYELVYGTLAALPRVPDLDLCLLADRAGGRRDHRDADARRGRGAATARAIAARRGCRALGPAQPRKR